MKDHFRKSYIAAAAAVIFALTFAGCKGYSSETVQSADEAAVPETAVVEIPVITPAPEEEPEETPVITPSPEPSPKPAPDPSRSFYAEEISDEIFARMEGKSFPEGCTTSRDDLRYLHLLYKDIDGASHEGEMVCNAQIASKLIYIFMQLYEADYPIERMVLVDEYDADDMASMSDNNTSCFNYRVVPGTTKISKHALGMAVDLNPRYNPYIYTRGGQHHVEPDNGADYVDRSADFDYKIDEDDLAYKLFTEAGFSWGGSWNSSKDYQHFQMP